MAVGLLLGYTSSKHIGLLLAAIVFAGAASISYYSMSWWPLAVGFVFVWALRLIGLDPSPRS